MLVLATVVICSVLSSLLNVKNGVEHRNNALSTFTMVAYFNCGDMYHSL